MHDFMAPLGFGQITGIDLHGEVRGTLPSTEWKRKAYRKKEQQKWYAGETISLGIGQGYNTFTMLQLAQATATMAAGGQRHRPHLVRAVEHYESRTPELLAFKAAAAAALEAGARRGDPQRALRRHPGGHGGPRRSPARPTRPAARPARRR